MEFIVANLQGVYATIVALRTALLNKAISPN